jgi:hypothetical protein
VRREYVAGLRLWMPGPGLDDRAQVTELTQFTGGLPGAPVGLLTSEQASADLSDLQAAIGDLAGRVAGSLGLTELLAVATFAVHAIPGADGAGVTLLRVDRIDNIVDALAASAPFVAEIDDIQADSVATSSVSADLSTQDRISSALVIRSR